MYGGAPCRAAGGTKGLASPAMVRGYMSFAMIESRYRWPCHLLPELLPQLRDFPIQVFDAEQTSRATADHAP